MSTNLSTYLKKPVWSLVAVVALSIAILATLPGLAQAQQTPADPTEADQDADGNTNLATAASRPAPETSGRLMVYPGDSLWSISQRELGPHATPQQIANEVERIFELNKDLIGDDPNVIAPGEELLLPSAPESATDHPPANGAQDTPAAAVVPAAKPPAVKSETSEPVEPASGATFHMPSAPEASWPGERKLIGWGILVPSLALGILVLWKLLMQLWKLSMRRAVRRGARTTTFAVPSYQAAPWRGPTNEVSGEPMDAPLQPQKSSSGFASKPLSNGQSHGYADLAVALRVRRKLRLNPRGLRSRKRSDSKGWATGVHNPQVRRALKRKRKPRGYRVRP
jgi:LysM repeat protein